LSQVIQVEQLVDDQKIDRFNLNLFVWSFLAMFCDGFDISVLSYAAPELVRTWGLDAASLGPAFSASLFGILFGAPLLGYVGDRYGRKSAIIIGCFIYGLCTLAIVWAASLPQIILLRFLTGIGIGGLLPNTISLNSELSPKRLRATLVVLMFTGITMGSASPGAITAWLAPQYGWQVFFLVGGVVPLIVSFCLLFTLPESVKFLAQQPHRQAELLKVARQLRGDLDIADDARFVLTPAPHYGGVGLRDIFSGGLALITPLLWLCFVTALMVNYFLGSWMPLLFEDSGLSPERAALASSIYHIGGALGGVLISVLIDRFGFMVVVALFALACPAVAILGLDGLSYEMLTLFAVIAGVGVLGAQFGNNATAGMLYPTSFRAKGAGWAFAIGRFGAICGPYIGGILIGMNLPMQKLFLIGAIPLIIGTIAAAILARVCYIRFDGLQLDDMSAEQKQARADGTTAG
jgi:AAHS family 4-hydroxybenzoate transporter-like MFS transporter